MAGTIPLWAPMNFAKRWILYHVTAFRTRLAEPFLSISCDLMEDLKAFASKLAMDSAGSSKGDGAIFERKRCGSGVAGNTNVNCARILSSLQLTGRRRSFIMLQLEKCFRLGGPRQSHHVHLFKPVPWPSQAYSLHRLSHPVSAICTTVGPPLHLLAPVYSHGL
jgi:hypothetical protein